MALTLGKPSPALAANDWLLFKRVDDTLVMANVGVKFRDLMMGSIPTAQSTQMTSQTANTAGYVDITGYSKTVTKACTVVINVNFNFTARGESSFRIAVDGGADSPRVYTARPSGLANTYGFCLSFSEVVTITGTGVLNKVISVQSKGDISINDTNGIKPVITYIVV